MAISKTLRYQILRRDNYTCRYCGRTPPTVSLEVDHIVPEALGGSDSPENLTAACEDCNGGKSATPADAAVVAQAATDAERWAAAQARVAERMLDDHRAGTVRRAEFDTAWRKSGNPPRPANWTASVDALISAGLPIEILLDCIHIATANRKVNRGDLFRYMCGVAWARIRKMREMVAVEARGIPEEIAKHNDSDEYERGIRAFASEILTYWTPDEIDNYIALARKQHLSHGWPDVADDYLYPSAADLAVGDAVRRAKSATKPQDS